jgi:hypothetical protein
MMQTTMLVQMIMQTISVGVVRDNYFALVLLFIMLVLLFHINGVTFHVGVVVSHWYCCFHVPFGLNLVVLLTLVLLLTLMLILFS